MPAVRVLPEKILSASRSFARGAGFGWRGLGLDFSRWCFWRWLGYGDGFGRDERRWCCLDEIGMHHGAVAGEDSGFDQFVVPVDREGFRRFVDQRFEEG